MSGPFPHHLRGDLPLQAHVRRHHYLLPPDPRSALSIDLH